MVCSANWEALLTDQHQMNAIIATAIGDCCKDHPDARISPQEAKQIAKCITEALANVGLQITPVNRD